MSTVEHTTHTHLTLEEVLERINQASSQTSSTQPIGRCVEQDEHPCRNHPILGLTSWAQWNVQRTTNTPGFSAISIDDSMRGFHHIFYLPEVWPRCGFSG
jgi:hypothetical protein